MDTWHCGTTHCLAGWCQVIRNGQEDNDTAYEAGVRNLPALARHFFDSDDVALAALRDFAAAATA